MIEYNVKNKSNEIINDLRKQYAEKGYFLTEENENWIRVGMSYGISLSAIALSSLPADITLTDEKQ